MTTAARAVLLAGMAAAALALAGCAGSVKHMGAAPEANVAKVPGVSQVVVQLSSDAAKKQADNAQFNRDELSGFLRRKLEGKGLVSTASAHRVEVEVTDIRVRSAFAAIMFGFMAGDDRIHGRVRLLDAQGKPTREFEVNASYALGGYGGGQDGTRMNWLYEKFADLSTAELEKFVLPSTPPVSAVPAVTRTAQ